MQVNPDAGQRPGLFGVPFIQAGHFGQMPAITQRLRLGLQQGQFKGFAGLAQQLFLFGGRDGGARGQFARRQ